MPGEGQGFALGQVRIQLLIVGCVGPNTRGGSQVRHVQALRVTSLYLVFGAIRSDGITLGVSTCKEAKGSGDSDS